jgi:hypothetical protein
MRGGRPAPPQRRADEPSPIPEAPAREGPDGEGAGQARAQGAARASDAAAAADDDQGDGVPQPEVLEQLADLHRRFDAEEIDFDDFEERKQELLAQLDV